MSSPPDGRGGQGGPAWTQAQDSGPYQQPRPAATATPRERGAWALQNLERMGVNWDAAPDLPFWAPLVLKTQQQYRSRVATHVLALSATLGRPLSRPELDAATAIFGRMERTSVYVVPSAALVATVAERRGRAAFRFPFYTPKLVGSAGGSFDPDVFPARAIPLLRGELARTGWRLVRLSGYFLLSGILLTGFWGSYARTIAAKNMLEHADMQDANEIMKRAGREILERRRRQAAAGGGSGGAQRERRQPGQQESSDSGGDASSAQEAYAHRTAAAEMFATASSERDPVSEGNTRRETRGRAAPVGQQADENTSSWASNQDDGFVFDDASPVASTARQARSQSSSWDRIRQQARSGDGSDGVREAQGRQTAPSSWAGAKRGPSSDQGSRDSTHDYTYSAAEAERAMSKEQAQKEFDAMLERERAGEGSNPRGRRV